MGSTDVDAIYQAVGELVRRHRHRANVTQEQLGQSVGLSRTSITNLEKGRQHIPIHHLYAIANALDVPPEALLPGPNRREIPASVARALPPDADESMLSWVRKVAG